ncbi:MAG: DNA glycosylase [Clostridia bacterium]|nr:DNA glycosylase [Clostridia bacterium]
MSIEIKLERDFSLRHTFDCGQCFRWNENGDGSYTGVAAKRAINISYDGRIIKIDGAGKEDEAFFRDYLDIDRDYSEIKKRVSKNDVMREAVAFGSGIRILRQEFFESLMSFIISQRSSIPKIKGCVEKICRSYGEERELSGKVYYTFPDAEALRDVKEEDYIAFGVGYRAKYLEKAVSDILSGKIDEGKIRSLKTPDAREALLEIFGVGNKVADCVLLFSLSRFDSFPVDVWVKRAMDEYFEGQDGYALFGEDSGFAQQYLFYKMRNGSK